MKKFFALALALVMALSLTTMAWGASALPADADDGATDNVVHLVANTAYEKITAVPDGTTIVGASGATVAGVYLTTAVNDLIFEGVTFTADVGVDSNVDGLTFDGCVFKKDVGMYIISNYGPTFPYTAQNVTVTGCYFEGAGNGDAFLDTATDETAIQITHANGDVTVTNNVIDGADWNGIQVGGSGDFVISGNTISNTGSRSMRLVNDAGDLTVTNNTMSNANLAEENDQVFKATGDSAVIAAAEAAATGNTYDNVAVGMNEVGVAATTEGGKYTSGVFFKDPTGSVAEGYVAVKTGPYSWSVVPASGTAIAATEYDMVTTDVAQVKTVGVTVIAYAAKAPKDTDKNGLLDQDGNVAYVVFSNLPGKYFVQVNSVSKADYTVYQNGTTALFGYFDEVTSPFYKGNGVAFANFGEKCGQYDDEPTVGAKYFLFQGVLYQADATYTSTTNLMVGSTLTPVVALADKFVDHVPAYTYDAKYVITAVKCAECGTPGVIYPNFASVPKADKAKAVMINDDDYYVWLAGPVATTPSTDKTVQSAQTFDAGTAMYVGMSVMAAAGGAVVIGKKKD